MDTKGHEKFKLDNFQFSTSVTFGKMIHKR